MLVSAYSIHCPIKAFRLKFQSFAACSTVFNISTSRLIDICSLRYCLGIKFDNLNISSCKRVRDIICYLYDYLLIKNIIIDRAD